jgi:hypothetical protein
MQSVCIPLGGAILLRRLDLGVFQNVGCFFEVCGILPLPHSASNSLAETLST